jgi:hypothetical protein
MAGTHGAASAATTGRLPQNNTIVDRAAKNTLHTFILTPIPFCRPSPRNRRHHRNANRQHSNPATLKSKAVTAHLAQNCSFAEFQPIISLFILAISID